jgi:hypothetical protein
MSDRTKVEAICAQEYSRTRYFVSIRLLRAYLCEDTDETQYHVWWIQHRYGLTDVRLAIVQDEVRQAAERHRRVGTVAENCATIDHQLAELEP